jgi:hypothetical protein
MTTVVEQLALEIERSGGTLELKADGRICFEIPKDAEHLLPLLREHKQELIPLLRRRAGYIRAFPACPFCGSYYLWRQPADTKWECQNCRLTGILEADARKAGARKDQLWQEAHA